MRPGRGIQGEDEVHSIVAGSRPVRDVTQRPHSGDFICDSGAGPVLIEVKNYSNSIPTAEVERFLRDLRERDAAAGVFLSLSSPIAGKRASVSVALEPRVVTGSLIPIVFAAAPRRNDSAGAEEARLSPDVILAAVDMAVCLAEVYPRGIQGLHGLDSMLAHAVASEQLAEGASSVCSELTKISESVARNLNALNERVSSLRREARFLAKTQRAQVEVVRETFPSMHSAFVGELRERFTIPVPDALLLRVVGAIEEVSVVARLLNERNRWQLLSKSAIHVHSACGFLFQKQSTLVRVPLTPRTAELLMPALTQHSKKVKVADGVVTVGLGEETLEIILALVGAL